MREVGIISSAEAIPLIPAADPSPAGSCIALVGNPNAGKTTLFNALTGLRAKTANFPGTTIEHRLGRTKLAGEIRSVLDLPGLYSLTAATPEERIARDALLGEVPGSPRPSVCVLLIDATNLERNLYLASQVMALRLPTVVALNMVDLARDAGIRIDSDRLAQELGCPVIPVVARTGEGVERLRGTLEAILADPVSAARPELPESVCNCSGCPFQARYDWAEHVGRTCSNGRPATHGRRTERIDRVLTHPVLGVLAFFSIMFVVFGLIFWIAQYPMDWIDGGFRLAQTTLGHWLPAGDLRSFLIDGILGGVGGVLIFLPQICILFLFLSLMEDTGYMARAAFVMDRLMRRVGLPGKSFVPLISAHACAVPAIMATRVVEDRRDRLVTILVLPLLTCSARIPVYAMITALLFSDAPLLAALVFTGAYSMGFVAALLMALLFKRTILPGETQPLVLELPGYKIPSLKTALLATYDRALIFVRRAGTIILVISMVLWFLASFPRSEPPPEARAIADTIAELRHAGEWERSAELQAGLDATLQRHRLANSHAGRIGHWVEPALRPLGFNWQIGVGLIGSFAAREVIVSTLAIVYGVGGSGVDDNPEPLYQVLRSARRADGTAVFDLATSVSLLIFYVLAMQCLPTQAVTRRETGTWRWPLFQLAYMSALAYLSAFVAYQTLSRFG